MRRMSKLLVVGVFVMTAAVALPQNMLAQGAEQTDHMLIDASVPEVGYCGLSTNAEPWTLNIAASNVGTGSPPGKLKIEFQDDSSITFNIGPNASISFSQQMGGVPGVDHLVRISLTTWSVAWVSARARPNTLDAFTEPGTQEVDNLCVNLQDEGPGIKPAAGVITASGWVDGGTGNLQ